MPRLDIRRAQRLSIHEIGGQPVRIGRSDDNDVVLKNIHVSRKHCVIERVGGAGGAAGEVRVRDLDSQSGTFVNGDRVTEAALFAGDRLSVGPFDLIIRAAPEEGDFVSRSAVMQEALAHVHIDDSTGLPVEGPAALVESLRQQLDAERKQQQKAATQIAALHKEMDQLRQEREQAMQEAAAKAAAPLSLDDGRSAELEQGLAQERERAQTAERRTQELEAQLDEARQTIVETDDRASTALSRVNRLDAELDRVRNAASRHEERAAELAALIESRSQGLAAAQRDEDGGAAGDAAASSTVEQIAELQGLLEIERRRAEMAEQRGADLASQLQEARRLVEDQAQASDRAEELQRQAESERERAEIASSRAAELAAELSHLQRQRESELEQVESALSRLRGERQGDLEQAAALRTQVDDLQRLLAEARSASETVQTERHAALKDLEEAQAEVARWRAADQEIHRSLETERAHAGDLNRALEEAWKKIEETAEQTREMQARLSDLESSGQQHSQRTADALSAHVGEIERLTVREADLLQQLEAAVAARKEMQQVLAEAIERQETAETSLHHALARADELEGASGDLHDRLAALEAEVQSQKEHHAADVAAKEKQIAGLRASEENLRQRLNNLEATKYAASEKAERALKTLNLLQGQIRSLDDAAAKVTDLQSRLAVIEEAWVAADETLEAVDESDESKLEAAVEERQRIVAQLDALNKARDEAVGSLRESALRLRSLAERETPAIIHPPATRPQPKQPEAVKAGANNGGGDAGKKWWKFGSG